METAELLAKAHLLAEPNLKIVRLIEPLAEENNQEPIKLLEVVEGTIERGVEPIQFSADPARGVDFNSTIVEVSPKEYKDICDGKLEFNAGWVLGRILLSSE